MMVRQERCLNESVGGGRKTESERAGVVGDGGTFHKGNAQRRPFCHYRMDVEGGGC